MEDPSPEHFDSNRGLSEIFFGCKLHVSITQQSIFNCPEEREVKLFPSPLHFPSSHVHHTSKEIKATWHTRTIPLSDLAGAEARQKACFPQPFTVFDRGLLLIWHCPHTSNDFPLAEPTSHLSPRIKGITLRPDKAYGHEMCCQRKASQLPPFPIQLPLFCWVLGPEHQRQQKGLYTSCEAELHEFISFHLGFIVSLNAVNFMVVTMKYISNKCYGKFVYILFPWKRKASEHPLVKWEALFFFPELLIKVFQLIL